MNGSWRRRAVRRIGIACSLAVVLFILPLSGAYALQDEKARDDRADTAAADPAAPTVGIFVT